MTYVRYLIEKYDTTHQLLPTEPAKRAKIRELMWAAEGTLMLHAEVVYSARLAAPAQVAPEIEAKLAMSVQHDLDWLEGHLKETSTRFLVGDHVTVADTMMAFSVQDIFALKLAPAGKSWPRINEWLKAIESRDVYQRAVKRTGHHF
jgi:glutathione S-transferase